MENSNFLYHQLVLKIKNWDIAARIHQKIPLWNLYCSKQKIQDLPFSFLQKAFIFYILKQLPYCIRNYSQDLLMSTSLALKKLYTLASIKYFKSSHNFDFAFVILSKALSYFLQSQLPTTSFSDALEADIYACLIEGVLGYSVDRNTYLVVEKKLQRKNNCSQRESIQIQEGSPQEKIGRSGKKIHRNGQFDPFCEYQTRKQHLDLFKIEIKEALTVKHFQPSCKPSTKIKTKQNMKPHNLSIDWQKNQFSVLKLHQVSSAMAVQPGFSQYRGSVGVHLSKKRELRQTFVPSEHKTPKKQFPQSTSEVFTSLGRQQSWGKIIKKMKELDSNKHYYASAANSPLKPSLLIQSSSKPNNCKKRRKNQGQSIHFKQLKGSQWVSFQGVQNVDETSPTNCQPFVRLSLAQQLDHFQKKCEQRRKHINRAESLDKFNPVLF